jgi:hypothetical protein
MRQQSTFPLFLLELFPLLLDFLFNVNPELKDPFLQLVIVPTSNFNSLGLIHFLLSWYSHYFFVTRKYELNMSLSNFVFGQEVDFMNKV